MQYTLDYYSELMKADVVLDIDVIISDGYNYSTPFGNSPMCLFIKNFHVDSGEIYSYEFEKLVELSRSVIECSFFEKEVCEALYKKADKIFDQYRKEVA